MEMSEEKKKETLFILVAAAASMVLAAWLTYLHVRLHTDVGYMSFCALKQGLNCETVAASTYSILLGLPVSAWGVLAYLAVIVVSIFDLGKGQPASLIASLTILCVINGLVSIVLALISALLVGSTCLVCTLSHVLSLAMAVAAVRGLLKRGGLRTNLSLELVSFRQNWVPLVYLAALLTIGIISGVGGLVPRYWTYAFWRTQSGIAYGFDDEGRAWIGAQNPKLVIDEYFDYECPSCVISHRKIRRLLGENSTKVRLVRHNFARMKCVPNNSVMKRASCSMARCAFCAGKQGRHWEWNDAAVAEPKPTIGPKRRDYELDLAKRLQFDIKEFENCLYSDEAVNFVQNQYLEATKARVRETPVYFVEGRRMDPKDILSRIKELP